MTERLALPDPHPGLVDRIAAWLFPGLYPTAPEPTGPRHPWDHCIAGSVTKSEFARIQAAAAAEGTLVLIDARIIPDREPEAGQ